MVANREKWVVLVLFNIKAVLHFLIGERKSDSLQLLLQGSPLTLLWLSCKPDLIISQDLIEPCLLSQRLHKAFDRVAHLHLFLQSSLSLLDSRISAFLEFDLVDVFAHSALGVDV